MQFPFRILIDQGSMRSFISENAMQLLKWDRVSNSTLVKGFNGRRTRARGRTTFTLPSIYNDDLKIPISALIVSSVCDKLP